MFNNKKWGSPSSFLSYKHLKPKLRVLLTGYPVAMVTSDVSSIVLGGTGAESKLDQFSTRFQKFWSNCSSTES